MFEQGRAPIGLDLHHPAFWQIIDEMRCDAALRRGGRYVSPAFDPESDAREATNG